MKIINKVKEFIKNYRTNTAPTTTVARYEVPPRAVPHIDGIVKTLKDSGFRVTVDTVVDRGSDYFDILIGW